MKIGDTVWTVNAITQKPDNKVVGATVAQNRVVSFDACTVVIVRAGLDEVTAHILEVISLRFVRRDKCYRTEAGAEQAKTDLLSKNHLS